MISVRIKIVSSVNLLFIFAFQRCWQQREILKGQTDFDGLVYTIREYSLRL